MFAAQLGGEVHVLGGSQAGDESTDRAIVVAVGSHGKSIPRQFDRRGGRSSSMFVIATRASVCLFVGRTLAASATTLVHLIGRVGMAVSRTGRTGMIRVGMVVPVAWQQVQTAAGDGQQSVTQQAAVGDDLAEHGDAFTRWETLAVPYNVPIVQMPCKH